MAQAAHVAAPVPHELNDWLAYTSHVPVPPLQQPFGHVFASHAHSPLVVSHRLFAHGAHAVPPVPQTEEDCDPYGTQVLPLQQPVGHEVASQTHLPVVVLHSCPVAQAVHAAPPVPQDMLVSEP